jgi:hypothetical protein
VRGPFLGSFGTGSENSLGLGDRAGLVAGATHDLFEQLRNRLGVSVGDVRQALARRLDVDAHRLPVTRRRRQRLLAKRR